MEKWFATKEPVKFGGVGPGETASDVARTVQAALGLPIKVIDGYKGTADIRLAVESGDRRSKMALDQTWQRRTVKSNGRA
jgi:glycerol-3-phosphate acyltransferase PlsY